MQRSRECGRPVRTREMQLRVIVFSCLYHQCQSQSFLSPATPSPTQTDTPSERLEPERGTQAQGSDSSSPPSMTIPPGCFLRALCHEVTVSPGHRALLRWYRGLVDCPPGPEKPPLSGCFPQEPPCYGSWMTEPGGPLLPQAKVMGAGVFIWGLVRGGSDTSEESLPKARASPLLSPLHFGEK